MIADLAPRLTACRDFDWGEGMAAVLPGGPRIRIGYLADVGNALMEHHWLPDLNDGATKGALVERLRVLLGEPTATPICINGEWLLARDVRPAFLCPDGGWAARGLGLLVCGTSEAELLVLAFEAVGRRER